MMRCIHGTVSTLDGIKPCVKLQVAYLLDMDFPGSSVLEPSRIWSHRRQIAGRGFEH